jgi:hypothetical protein
MTKLLLFFNPKQHASVYTLAMLDIPTRELGCLYLPECAQTLNSSGTSQKVRYMRANGFPNRQG